MHEPPGELALRPAPDRTIDRALYAIPHDAPFLCTLTIGREHCSDVIEHLNNVVLVRCLDRAAELHADALGYTRRYMLGEGIMWFIARHEIDYLAEAWPGEELLIATWVRDMLRVKSWRDYVIVRPADDTIIARAATLWVLVDLESRRPRSVSTEMAARFHPMTPMRPTAELPGR